MEIGVLRRIDNLGRIVIPKSIRKTLRIKPGDSIQVFTEEKKIILKKYSELKKIEEIIQMIKKILEQNIKLKIYITDKEKIINNKEQITKELQKIIENRKTVVKKNIKITKKINYKEMVSIFPVIVNGDAVGSIIILSCAELSEKELSTVKVAKDIIIKILEE